MTIIWGDNGIAYGTLEFEDDLNSHRFNTFKDDYTLLAFTPGETIVINLSSDKFDTYLQLIDSDTGEIIAENNNFGEELNSRLIFTPQENVNYLIRVTSLNEAETGNYILTSNLYNAETETNVDLVIEDAEATIVYYDEYSNETYLDLSWTVTNLGTETAVGYINNDDYYYSNWYDTVYLSSDENFDPLEDYWLTSHQYDFDLQSGDSYTEYSQAYVYHPNVWGLENIYLIFVTDSNNYQYETNENNNIFTIPLNLELTPPDVDLVVTDAEVAIANNYYFDKERGEFSQDKNSVHINLALAVTNQGSEAINNYYYYDNAWYDGVYLSSDENFDPLEDYFISDLSDYNYYLEAGDSYTQYFETDIYKQDIWKSGDWQSENNYIILVTDSNDNQYETNEHNNTFAVPVDLDLTPPDVDLVVTDATVAVTSDEYYNETYLDLSWTITNLGSDTIYNNSGYGWYDAVDAVYLSSDKNFDPLEDYWINDFWYEFNLQAGESYTEYSQAYVYHPDIWELENNYLIFVADSNGNQYETNEHNNTFAIPVELNLTLADVDLVVTDAQATLAYYEEYYYYDEYSNSEIYYADAYLDLSWTIINQGSDASAYGWYDSVYLSSDQYFDPIEDYWIAGLEYYNDPLEAGESYTSEYYGAYVSGEQLNALKSGELNLLFVSNADRRQYETDETNNAFVGSLVNSIYRFYNQDLPGTYLYAGEEERSHISIDFSNFYEEGIAFQGSITPQDDLIPLYRFQSKIAPGTYLYVGEEERANIHQNHSDSFAEEGLSFYVYGVGEGKGATFYRFRNDNSNFGSTYLFATGAEAENIRHNFPDFIEEGAAFEAVI